MRGALGRGGLRTSLYFCGLGQTLLLRQSVSAEVFTGVPMLLGEVVSACTVLFVGFSPGYQYQDGVSLWTCPLFSPSVLPCDAIARVVTRLQGSTGGLRSNH